MTDQLPMDVRLASAMEALGFAPDGGPVDVDIADKTIFALTGAMADREELRKDLEAVTTERDQLLAERDNLAADLDKAVARYQVARRKNEGKGRAVGVLKTLAADDAIAEALDGPVELVFSDGKKEITGIDPVHVSGRAAWVTHPTGQMLRDRVLLAGPAPAEGVFTVAGVGLLVDGKQVGWCAFHDPLSIAGGATVELRDSIIF